MISELDNYIWHSLPATKYIAGRRVVRRIARRAAERFPTEIMESISMQGRARMLEQIADGVEREERQQYGMGIILTLVLSALISEIVKAALGLVGFLQNKPGPTAGVATGAA